MIIDRNNGLNTETKYTIICTLKNSCNNHKHQFKFYLNKKFSREMKRFKKKFFSEYDIDKCEIENENNNNIEINPEDIIKDIGLKNNSIILVKCEEK